MIEKWKTKHGEYRRIDRVECTRETDKCVWVIEEYYGTIKKNRVTERRHMKKSEFYNYHDTWDDAHKFLIETAEKELNSARLRLERAQGVYGNVKGMRKPADPDETTARND